MSEFPNRPVCASANAEHPAPDGPFRLNEYLTNRAYGGLEEGGWWYDTARWRGLPRDAAALRVKADPTGATHARRPLCRAAVPESVPVRASRPRVARRARPPAPVGGGGPAGIGASRPPPEESHHVPFVLHTRRSRAVNAPAIAAALSLRAEAVCRQYLPHGRRQGRYWVAGDLDGARGRSLYVRLRGPGTPGKWTDAAEGTHGDLLDLIRHRINAPTLRAALDEARAFLALPAAPAAGEGPGDSYDATQAARRLWTRCRAIDGTHAESYLRARGLARCRFSCLRFHPELRYREGSSVRRLPALVAAVTGDDGAVTGVQRTWLDPRSPAKAGVASPRKALGRVYGRAVRFGRPDATLLVGEGIETVLSVVTAVPEVKAAAALSAGSLGAFAPPPGLTRLLIARDNDEEGERAAMRLARRCARARLAALCLVPEGDDFNDDLVALGRDALAARLSPLLRVPLRTGSCEWECSAG